MTRCPRSSRVGYRIRIQAKEVVERSGVEMMANVPTWHGRSWSMRLWLASTEVVIPEESDASWDPSPAESAPFAQGPLLDVPQVEALGVFVPIGPSPRMWDLEYTTTIQARLVLSLEHANEVLELPQIVLVREVVINVMLVKSAPVHADDHSELWKESVLDFFVLEGVDELQEVH